MPDQNSPQIINEVADFQLRGNYPNTYSRFADSKDRQAHSLDKLSLGNRAPRVEYTLQGSELTSEIIVRGVDLPILNNPDIYAGCVYLTLLIKARQGDQEAQTAAAEILQAEQEKNDEFCRNLTLIENEFLVPSYTANEYRKERVSHKGVNLLKLSQHGFPVPDFCILTTDSHLAASDLRSGHIADALNNLENMTGREVGSSSQPLIFALRYAMPSYMPGLMPTYLNVGVTEKTFPTLCRIYGREAGHKMYLNNLKNMAFLVDPELEDTPEVQSLLHDPRRMEVAIAYLLPILRDKDPQLLTDAQHQACFLDYHSHQFFLENQELIFTLSKGRSTYSSLIIQQMICTVRGEGSYPGVMCSRNPNTGRYRTVESKRNVFGEDIMTGTVQTTITEFAERDEIKKDFPALYHFVPLLPVLEKEFACSVTTEFAAEAVRCGHFFSLLQLNESEMTGRASLVSAMDMYHEGIIAKQKVPGLVQPYHFRQIMSDTIDEEAFDSLEFFARGFSILPRSAVSAKIYFSAESALRAKNRGEDNVCFCKHRFLPSDAVVMGKMDVILSLTPAAIHVVTTCRGLGILAFLNLEKYGVQLLDNNRLVSATGMEISEGDWITVTSKLKKIYRGKAQFTPARFNQYLQGQQLDLEAREEPVFQLMKQAFSEYHDLTHSLKAEQVETYYDLVKLVQADLRNEEECAAEIVNSWYDFYTQEFVDAIFKSDLGSHRKQAEVYTHLTLDRRLDFFHKAVARCQEQELAGLTAGSFMLGRFIQIPHGIAFWNQMKTSEIGVVVNEWIQYQKYQQVLLEVGEHRIVRARQMLESQPDREMRLRPTDAKLFMHLKLSQKDLQRVEQAVNPKSCVETADLVRLLQQPYGYFYDYNFRWSINSLKKICEDEGIPLPDKDAH